MRSCSVVKNLEIVRGGLADYKQLCRFHYRDCGLGPFAAIFTMKAKAGSAVWLGDGVVGVIVYKMPSPGLELRNVATGGYFGGFDRSTRLSLVNSSIRCIGRVIIDPRFRGLGLASRLVRETMGLMGVPIIEAMAVMGAVNPFFERAGMTAYRAKMPGRCVQLVEAFSMVGIEGGDLLDSRRVGEKIESLSAGQGEFIEAQIQRFLQSYSKRRYMLPGDERIRYVLGKLTSRPIYYIWFNPEME